MAMKPSVTRKTGQIKALLHFHHKQRNKRPADLQETWFRKKLNWSKISCFLISFSKMANKCNSYNKDTDLHSSTGGLFTFTGDHDKDKYKYKDNDKDKYIWRTHSKGDLRDL